MTDPRPATWPGWEEDHRRTDAEHMATTLRYFPSAVVAVAALVDGVAEVMVATSFTTGVSHRPPMCMFAVQDSSSTWRRLRQADRIGVTVLGAAHGPVVHQLASRRTAGRLDGIAWTRLPSDAVVLFDGPVWLECEVVQQHRAGDHHVVIVEVHGSSVLPAQPPLIHHDTVFGALPVPAEGR